jgi:hypothetical protein
MATDENRGKALELALSSIEKQYGKGAIMRLGTQNTPPVEVIPSGSLSLDLALGDETHVVIANDAAAANGGKADAPLLAFAGDAVVWFEACVAEFDFAAVCGGFAEKEGGA